jgi:4-hydroxy-L-threonine phosphate dehydrogenase PdxA
MSLQTHQRSSGQPVLRVSLVTTHPPLSEVPRLVTRERILRSLKHTADFVARLGLSGPIGVCGLNPHAGESGRIGREDEEVVGPAVREAKAAGVLTLGLVKNGILTSDQVRSLRMDNVVSPGARTLADLGIKPTGFAAVIPEYLWRFRPSGQYAALKDSAKKLKKV